MFDHARFGKDMGQMVAEALAPIRERLTALEAKAAEVIEGPPGPPGKDADPVEVTTDDLLAALKSDPAFLREAVAEYLKANPPSNGKDGASVVGAMIDSDGDLVLTLADGVMRKCGKVRERVAFSTVEDAVAEYVKANPLPRGEKGEPGAPGRDGAGVTGAMIDHDGVLIVTLSDGTLQRCGRVVGRDGADLTDLGIEFDGERTVTLTAGGKVAKTITLPTLIDRGYWRDGMEAKQGDGFTHDGSYWIAQRDTKAKPAAGDDWRLVVRKGRDAK